VERSARIVAIETARLERPRTTHRSGCVIALALRIAVVFGLMLAVLSIAAGRADVWGFWAWAIVMWLTSVGIHVWLRHINPDLLAERMRPPSDRDRPTRWLMLLPLLAAFVVTGLDVRLGWSTVPLPVQIAGLVLVVLGILFAGWVLVTNPFASSAVRIQQDRGQHVISTGPLRARAPPDVPRGARRVPRQRAGARLVVGRARVPHAPARLRSPDAARRPHVERRARGLPRIRRSRAVARRPSRLLTTAPVARPSRLLTIDLVEETMRRRSRRRSNLVVGPERLRARDHHRGLRTCA